jgi:hypothetical protein
VDRRHLVAREHPHAGALGRRGEGTRGLLRIRLRATRHVQDAGQRGVEARLQTARLLRGEEFDAQALRALPSRPFGGQDMLRLGVNGLNSPGLAELSMS